MEPQMDTDKHGFLRQVRNDFSIESCAVESCDLSAFIRVPSYSFVAKKSVIVRAFSCLFVAKNN